MKSIIVFSKKRTNRLQYTLDVVLQQLLGLDFQIITNQEAFQASLLPKINYSTFRISPTELQIPAHPLLFEKNIKIQNFQVKKVKGLPAFFFMQHDKLADFSFDLFAMNFYLLSRYEEYLPSERDIHNRFIASKSLAFQHDFLKHPILNQWVNRLRKMLQIKFPSLLFKKNEYQFHPTYDIDFAWAYLHKGWWRTFAGFSKDLIQLKFSTILSKLQVHIGFRQDPFFTFDYLQQLHDELQVPCTYFFLLGDYGKWDKNTPFSRPVFQALIQRIAAKNEVGIHPSYQSNIQPQRVQVEKNRLEKITQSSIQNSRQHFLKLIFPDTYRTLLKAGILHDFTMGYAAELGFRASIATSFPWYDLEKEKKTDLTIHPFQVMDVTLQQYLQLSPSEAIEKTKALIQITQEVGGTFSTLWHNSSFEETGIWKNWKEVYEKIFEAALP